MRLFLVRHGETVDNVAGLYAGVRDSALTNHGVLQAERLGRHLASTQVKICRIFSSDLQRAHKTAEAIRKEQITTDDAGDQHAEQSCLATMQLPVLREQDFGFYEGKPFYARPADSKRSGKEAHQDQHKHEADFQDVESKDSMAVRMDCFLNEHLIPVLAEQTLSENAAIVVVSHGIILSVLWRCFLRRFLVGNISATPGLLPAGNSPEYLGGWSNTGYLEIEVTVGDFPLLDATTTADADVDQTNTAPQSTSLLTGWRISIKTVNGRDHLQGFKRTRGGVGSSKHEEGQRKIESFFKKKKIG